MASISANPSPHFPPTFLRGTGAFKAWQLGLGLSNLRLTPSPLVNPSFFTSFSGLVSVRDCFLEARSSYLEEPFWSVIQISFSSA